MRQQIAKVKIRVEGGDKYKPEFQGDQKYSVCMDLKAKLPKDRKGNLARLRIYPGEVAEVHTGVFLELPEGFEAEIRPRSGLALKDGVTVINSPGTIDTGYRGELIIGLTNLKHSNVDTFSGMPDKNHLPCRIEDGDRIAQLAIREIPKVEVEWIEKKEELTSTARGNKGIGSTGK